MISLFFHCMENLYMAEKSTNSRKCLDIGILTAYNRENRLIVDQRRQIMKKGERRKDELIKIAYKKFLEKGYEQTSVDEIIEEAHIAKGTYYYYFQSKEEMLEEVVEMMLENGSERAVKVSNSTLSIPEKIVGTVLAYRPMADELVIQDTLNQPENIYLHDKVYKKLISKAVPLISEIVREGIRQGVFDCEQIEEHVKMILIISSQIFDSGDFTANDVIAFIDIVEKSFGAKAGTMGFIRELIGRRK